MVPASRVPFTRLQSLVRLHLRRSRFSGGKSEVGLSLRLRIKPAKQNSNRPAENLESNAPANAKPNFKLFARVASRHISASVHIVNSEKRVMATSVMTNGPKTRNAGVVTYATRHSSPPHSPPIRDP